MQVEGVGVPNARSSSTALISTLLSSLKPGGLSARVGDVTGSVQVLSYLHALNRRHSLVRKATKTLE